jgi:hypothetical protein
MAEMITCPHCGHPANPALALHIPGCRGPLRTATDGKPQRPDDAAPTDESDTDPAARHRRCRAPGCGGTIPLDAASCPLCETPVVSAFALVFPTTARPLEELPVVLGRDPTRSPFADLCGDHGNVSRVHAEIVSSYDGIAIRDLGSTNGTFVNDAHVGSQPVPLVDGDIVRLGRDMRVAVRHG